MADDALNRFPDLGYPDQTDNVLEEPFSPPRSVPLQPTDDAFAAGFVTGQETVTTPAESPGFLDSLLGGVVDTGEAELYAPESEEPPPLPGHKPAVTDFSETWMSDEDLERMAGEEGSVGVLHTLGEEFGTREGLRQKLPYIGQADEFASAAKAYMAAKRFTKSEYASPEEEQEDMRTLLSFMNRERYQQKLNERRTVMGGMVQVGARAIPYAAEFLLSNAFLRRLGLSRVGTAMSGEARAEMSAARLAAVKGLNRMIGEGIDGLVLKKIKDYAAAKGTDKAFQAWIGGAKTLADLSKQEAVSGIVRNAAARRAMGSYVREAEVDVAQKLIKDNLALRGLSFAFDAAVQTPMISPFRLVGGMYQRQLSRYSPVMNTEDGTLIFTESNEAIPDSVWKNALSQYFEVATEFSGGVMGNLVKGAIKKALPVRLAQLASRLPGKVPALQKLDTLVKSPVVQRGRLAGQRILDRMGARAAIYDPIGEYSEEWLNGLANSVFNLDDDGKTPWGTRVVTNLFHPLTKPREALIMLGGFSFMPATAFTIGMFTGQVPEEIRRRNYSLLEQTIHPTGSILRIAGSQEDMRRSSDNIFNILKEERLTQADTPIWRSVLKALGMQPTGRPAFGSMLYYLEREVGGQTVNADMLRKVILDAPETVGRGNLYALMEAAYDGAVLRGISRAPGESVSEAITREQDAFATMSDLFDMQPIASHLLRDITGKEDLQFVPWIENIRTEAVPRGDFAALPGHVARIQLTRMQEDLRNLQAVKTLVPADRAQEYEQVVGNLQSTLKKIETDPEMMRRIGPYSAIVSPEMTQLASVMGSAVNVNKASLKAPAVQERLGERMPKERLSGITDTFEKLLDVPEASKFRFFVLPMGRRPKTAAYGERIPGDLTAIAGETRKTSHASTTSLEGTTDVYITPDASERDVAEEVTHDYVTGHKKDVFSNFAASLLASRSELYAVDAEKLPLPVFEYLQYVAPAKMKIEDFLRHVARTGELPQGTRRADKFEEDIVKVYTLRLGYDDQRAVAAPVLEDARNLYAVLAGNSAFKQTTEMAFSADPIMKALRKKELPIVEKSLAEAAESGIFAPGQTEEERLKQLNKAMRRAFRDRVPWRPLIESLDQPISLDFINKYMNYAAEAEKKGGGRVTFQMYKTALSVLAHIATTTEVGTSVSPEALASVINSKYQKTVNLRGVWSFVGGDVVRTVDEIRKLFRAKDPKEHTEAMYAMDILRQLGAPAEDIALFMYEMGALAQRYYEVNTMLGEYEEATALGGTAEERQALKELAEEKAQIEEYAKSPISWLHEGFKFGNVEVEPILPKVIVDDLHARLQKHPEYRIHKNMLHLTKGGNRNLLRGVIQDPSVGKTMGLYDDLWWPASRGHELKKETVGDLVGHLAGKGVQVPGRFVSLFSDRADSDVMLERVESLMYWGDKTRFVWQEGKEQKDLVINPLRAPYFLWLQHTYRGWRKQDKSSVESIGNKLLGFEDWAQKVNQYNREEKPVQTVKLGRVTGKITVQPKEEKKAAPEKKEAAPEKKEAAPEKKEAAPEKKEAAEVSPAKPETMSDFMDSVREKQKKDSPQGSGSKLSLLAVPEVEIKSDDYFKVAKIVAALADRLVFLDKDKNLDIPRIKSAFQASKLSLVLDDMQFSILKRIYSSPELLKKLLVSPPEEWMKSVASLADADEKDMHARVKESLRKAMNPQSDTGRMPTSEESDEDETSEDGSPNDIDEGTDGTIDFTGYELGALLRSPPVRLFFNLLNLRSEGINGLSFKTGERQFETLLWAGAADRQPVIELVKKAMRSKDEFKKAQKSPTLFYDEAFAKVEGIPESMRSFWIDTLAPIFNAYTYEELARGKGDQFGLMDALSSVTLNSTLQYVRNFEYPSQIKVTNVSHAETSFVSRIMEKRMEMLFQELRSRKTFADQKGYMRDLLKACIGRSKLFENVPPAKYEDHFKSLSPQKQGEAAADILEGIFPSERFGLTREDISSAVRSDPVMAASAVYQFLRQFSYSAYDLQADKEMRADPTLFTQRLVTNIFPSIRGDKTQVRSSLVEHVYGRALIRAQYRKSGGVMTPYSTMARVGVKSKNARSFLNSTTLSLTNPYNSNELFKLGLLKTPYLRPDQIFKITDSWIRSSKDRPGNSSRVAFWTGEDREYVLREIIMRDIGEGNSETYMPLLPNGDNEALPFLRVPLFRSPEELIKKYDEVYEWLKSHGGINGVTTPGQFKATLGEKPGIPAMATGNFSLYLAVFNRMLLGRYDYYTKKTDKGRVPDMFNVFKRSTQTYTAGIHLLPQENLPGEIRFIRIQTPPMRGLPPDSKFMDGNIYVTDEGAKSLGATRDELMIKALVTGVIPEEYRRVLLKGNLIWLTPDGVQNLDPALRDMAKWINTYNAEHPGKPVHIITLSENYKVTDPAFKTEKGVPAIVRVTDATAKDAGALRFVPEEMGKAEVHAIPLDFYSIVAHQNRDAKLGPIRPSNQSLGDLSGLKHMPIVKQALYKSAGAYIKTFPKIDIDASEEDLKKAINFYSLEEDDELVLSDLWKKDRRSLLMAHSVQGKLGAVIDARIVRHSLGRMQGLITQSVGEAVDALKFGLSYHRFLRSDGTRVRENDLREEAEGSGNIFLDPGDIDGNFGGSVRYQKEHFAKLAVNTEKEAENAVLDFMWRNLEEYSDCFRSQMGTDKEGRPALVLKRELLPDVRNALNIRFTNRDGVDGWKFTIRGEPTIITRIPGTGPESSSLVRLRHRVSTGGRTNIHMVNDRLVVKAGEDFDGDQRFCYFLWRDPETGKAHGFEQENKSRISAAGVISLAPGKGQEWSLAIGGNVAFQTLVHDLTYLSESPEYFSPSTGVVGVTHALDPDAFKYVTEQSKKEDAATYEKEGFNGPLGVSQMLRVGGMDARARAVRMRNTILFLNSHNILPDKEDLQVRVPGFENPLVYSAHNPFDQKKKQALDEGSGNIANATFDYLKNWDAPHINLTKDLMVLIYSTLVSNHYLERVSMNGTEKTEADYLKSVEGTLKMLKEKTFTPAVKEAVAFGSYQGSMAQASRPRITNWNAIEKFGEDFLNWIRVANELQRVNKIHDAFRKFQAAKLEKLPYVNPDMVKTRVAGKEKMVDVFTVTKDSAEYKGMKAWVKAKMPIFNPQRIMETPEYEHLRTLIAEKERIGGLPLKFYATLSKREATKPGEETVKKWAERIARQYSPSYETEVQSVWNYFDNRFTEMLIPFQASLKPKLSESFSTVPREAAENGFMELPAKLRRALVAYAFARWGLTGTILDESYAPFIPLDEIKPLMDLVLEDARKFEKTAVVEAPMQVAQSAPPTESSPAKQSLLAVNQFEEIVRDLNPVEAVHKELLIKDAWLKNMTENVRLEADRLRMAVGAFKYAEGNRILEAMTAFLSDTRAYDPETGKLRIHPKDADFYLMTPGSAEMRITLDWDPEQRKMIPNVTFGVKPGTPTVAQYVKQYEELRKKHPELMSVNNILLACRKFSDPVLKAVKEHIHRFTDSPDFVNDVRSNKMPVYIPQRTEFPFAKSSDEEISKAVDNLWKNSADPFEAVKSGVTITVDPLTSKASYGRRSGAPASAEEQAYLDSLRNMAIEDRDKIFKDMVQGAIDAAKRAKEQNNLFSRSMSVRETSGHMMKRKYDSYFETFSKIGRVPQEWNFATLMETYAMDIGRMTMSKRYLGSLAMMTDIMGLPSAIFIRRRPNDPTEKLILDKSLATAMFYNLRKAVLKDSPNMNLPAFDASINPWDNLENLAKASRDWMLANGYVEKRYEADHVRHFQAVYVKAGPPRQLLDHALGRGFGDINNKTVRGILEAAVWFAQFTKELGLSVSLFHVFALTENYASSYGISWKNPILTPWGIWKMFRQIHRTAKEVVHDPLARHTIAPWLEAGMNFRFKAFGDNELMTYASALDSQMTKAVEFFDKNKFTKASLGRGVRIVRTLKRANDNFLWDYLQPAMKLITAERMFAEAIQDSQYMDLAVTVEGQKKLRREIAVLVNHQFGGQLWTQHIWATPFARNVMSLILFAPDWTISNLQMAGIPELARGLTGVDNALNIRHFTEMKSSVLEKFWPAFILITLQYIPMLWQALIYEMFGDPDKKDKRWMIENEEGKEASVDITPLMRQLGYSLGKTGQRRSYIKWGKSGYEILHWFERPWRSFLGKSSTPVRMFWEQFTGTNAIGWSMPWARQGVTKPFFGLFTVDDKFFDSRLGYIVRPFIPMSFVNMLDGKPPSVFASLSLGKSEVSAASFISDVLYAYSKENFWSRIRGNPKRVKRLATLVDETLDAVWRNGYDPSKVVDTGAGMARRKLQQEFFQELNDNPAKPNVAKLEEIARQDRRIQATWTKLYDATRERFKYRKLRMRPEQIQAAREAWQRALQEEP